MFLSKKDTPPGFQGMWYAGVANLAVCCLNTLILYLNPSIYQFIIAVLPLITAIVVFTAIKRRTGAMMWAKLAKGIKNADGTKTTTAPIATGPAPRPYKSPGVGIF